jgi:hypothetical protein
MTRLRIVLFLLGAAVMLGLVLLAPRVLADSSERPPLGPTVVVSSATAGPNEPPMAASATGPASASSDAARHDDRDDSDDDADEVSPPAAPAAGDDGEDREDCQEPFDHADNDIDDLHDSDPDTDGD